MAPPVVVPLTHISETTVFTKCMVSRKPKNVVKENCAKQKNVKDKLTS